jgi:subfamily B ATP-binding cassette protein MsbA
MVYRKAALGDEHAIVLIKRIIRNYLVRHRWRLALAVLCMIVVAGTTAALAKLAQPLIDEVFKNQRAEMLLVVAGLVVVVSVVRGLAAYGESLLLTQITGRITAQLRKDLFASVMRADLALFNAESPGRLIARFANDIGALSVVVADTLSAVFLDGLTFVALVALMYYEDWVLAIAASVAFPAAALATGWFGAKVRRLNRRVQEGLSDLTTLATESFQGAKQIKAYGMEGFEQARIAKAVDRVYRNRFAAGRAQASLRPIIESLGGVASAALILYGGSMVIEGVRSPGTYIAFMTALYLSYLPMKRLSRLHLTMQGGLAAAERVFQLMDLESRIVDRPGAVPLRVTDGVIRFEKVGFAYLAGVPTLKEVSLEVPAKSTVALVGPSGAGKSTILDLIPRFFDVTSGRVTIDGRDVRDVTLESLRSQVALVSQNVLLLDETILANIAYGRAAGSREDVEEASRLAGAHDFICALPEGYETVAGPRGVKLSGGEQQRIAVARAILKNAPILLLDEATSALDSATERVVQQSLRRLMAGRTTLAIAHRLSTVIGADLIYVVEDGRIVERGSHAELLRMDGAYARLFHLQFARPDLTDQPRAAAPAGYS